MGKRVEMVRKGPGGAISKLAGNCAAGGYSVKSERISRIGNGRSSLVALVVKVPSIVPAVARAAALMQFQFLARELSYATDAASSPAQMSST